MSESKLPSAGCGDEGGTEDALAFAFRIAGGGGLATTESARFLLEVRVDGTGSGAGAGAGIGTTSLSAREVVALDFGGLLLAIGATGRTS